MSRLLSYDQITGLETWHDYDSSTDETIISYKANSTPILELNKSMANDSQFTSDSIKRGMWLYASFPVEVQMQWLINDGIDVYNKDHGARISQKLEDPDYRYLKTTHKHHKFK